MQTDSRYWYAILNYCINDKCPKNVLKTMWNSWKNVQQKKSLKIYEDNDCRSPWLKSHLKHGVQIYFWNHIGANIWLGFGVIGGHKTKDVSDEFSFDVHYSLNWAFVIIQQLPYRATIFNVMWCDFQPFIDIYCAYNCLNVTSACTVC